MPSPQSKPSLVSQAGMNGQPVDVVGTTKFLLLPVAWLSTIVTFTAFVAKMPSNGALATVKPCTTTSLMPVSCVVPRNLELAGRVDEGAHAVDIDAHAISVGSVAAASIDDRVGRVVADQ